MRWLNARCLMLGHDDRVRRVPGRIYLECDECGRKTPGWDLTRTRGPVQPVWSWTDVWRAIKSQAGRDWFQTIRLSFR